MFGQSSGAALLGHSDKVTLGRKRMSNHFTDRWEGPIRGLRLPLTAWNSLSDEGITTVYQLRVVADQLERLPGIGPKTAGIIRDELARISAPEW